MFLPTRAHVKEIVEGQYRIRLGNRVPKDAVNLAYAHIPALSSRENVLITDLSNTILENARNNQVGDIIMHPDESLILRMPDGTTELPTTDVLITNIFKDDVPLYYAQTLTYYHYDIAGPDEYGTYQGNGIAIVDRLGKPIDRPYRVQLIDEPNYSNLYRVIVFTSFKDAESDTYHVVYNAVDMKPDGRMETMAGFREPLNLRRAFQRKDSLTDIIRQVHRRDNSPTYYQGGGSHPSYSKFYVPTPPVVDTREPEFFRYQVGLELEIKGERYIWTTPWYSDHVFNVNALTVEEQGEYVNGNKIVTKVTAEEVMRNFADKDYFTDIRAKKKYFVISDNDAVKVFTRLDGSSPIYATTNAATDQKIRIPLNARRSREPITETGTLSFRARPLRGRNNEIANITFVIDSSRSIKHYDADRGQRKTIMRDIVNSAKSFYREIQMNGYYFNFGTFAFHEAFTSNLDELIQNYIVESEDTDITKPVEAIDVAMQVQGALPDTFNGPAFEMKNLKFIVLVTDGRFEDFQEFEDKILEASARNIRVCVVTFGNYDTLKAICDRNKTLCIDAMSPRLGTFLRYFFFDLAGITESKDLGVTQTFTVSPDEGEKSVMMLDNTTFAIPADVLAEKNRFGIEMTLEAHPSVSVYIKDDPVNRIIPTYNGGNIIPVNYMEIQNVYRVLASCSHYAYKFNHTFAIRMIDNQQVRVLPPREVDGRYSWYPRIKNGRFERRVIENGLDTVYYYGVPEYYRQDFLPDVGLPYMKVRNERPKILNDSQIKVMYTPLFVRTEQGEVTNLLVTVNGKPLRVRSWSIYDGVIELDGTITENDHIVVNYEYEEETYVYRGYYDEIAKRFWSLDLNPGPGHYVTIRDRNDGTIKNVSSFLLINETIYVYLRPVIKMQDDGTGTLRVVQVNPTAVFHTFEKLNDRESILIAKIHVRPNANAESIRFLDTRVRGGGLKPEINEAIMREFEGESFFYWDIGHWDGQPYSENAVAVFRITRKVLKEYGGRFTKAEVEEKLEKHLGYGVLPIIEFIEDSDELLSIPEGLVVEVLDVNDNDDVSVERPTFRLTVEG